MNILILANDDEGLYQFRKELLEELQKSHKVYASVPDGPYRQDLINLGCELFPVQLNRHGVNPLKDLLLLKSYKRIIKKTNAQVVLTYTIKPNVYGGFASSCLKVPYIANITGLGTAVENKGAMQRITLALYRIGLRKAEKVFFQNKENQAFMLNHKVVNGPYDLVPGSGVNLNHFHKMDYPQGDTVEFAFISRIMKEKGIDQYLDAACYIHEKYSNTQFHVCGYCEQNYEDRLKGLNDNGTIIYHGCIRDVRKIHRISQCTIHPSYYPEGMSNVLLESAACCRPIITTDRSGCKEVIDDGINGYIVKRQDSKDLIEKIERFLSLSWDKKRDMGLAGRIKVENEFDRQLVVKKYLQEIELCER